jgi:hypothetical protein
VTISELISVLQDLQGQRGDLEVLVTYEGVYSELTPDRVIIEEFRRHDEYDHRKEGTYVMIEAE